MMSNNVNGSPPDRAGRIALAGRRAAAVAFQAGHGFADRKSPSTCGIAAAVVERLPVAAYRWPPRFACRRLSELDHLAHAAQIVVDHRTPLFQLENESQQNPQARRSLSPADLGPRDRT